MILRWGNETFDHQMLVQLQCTWHFARNRESFACVIWTPEKFCPRHLESWALKCSICWGISRSHLNGWNPESKFHWQRLEFSSWNSESTTWNAKPKTVLDSFRPVSNVVLLLCRTQFINYKYIRIHLEVCLTVSLLLWFFFGNSRSIDWIKFDVWNQVHCSSKSCPGWGGGGTPGNSWWGCAAWFLKPWPDFRPKIVIFHTRPQTRTLKSIPVFRPAL